MKKSKADYRVILVYSMKRYIFAHFYHQVLLYSVKYLHATHGNAAVIGYCPKGILSWLAVISKAQK